MKERKGSKTKICPNCEARIPRRELVCRNCNSDLRQRIAPVDRYLTLGGPRHEQSTD